MYTLYPEQQFTGKTMETKQNGLSQNKQHTENVEHLSTFC